MPETVPTQTREKWVLPPQNALRWNFLREILELFIERWSSRVLDFWYTGKQSYSEHSNYVFSLLITSSVSTYSMVKSRISVFSNFFYRIYRLGHCTGRLKFPSYKMKNLFKQNHLTFSLTIAGKSK